jgi:hypothetical protein
MHAFSNFACLSLSVSEWVLPRERGIKLRSATFTIIVIFVKHHSICLIQRMHTLYTAETLEL